MEGDLRVPPPIITRFLFLPTPSHGGRLVRLVQLYQAICISTHALTWRATFPISTRDLLIVISTHALTWRATKATARLDSRPCISTHALTWRATPSAHLHVLQCGHFYPRPHMEGDSKHAEVQACISAAYLKCSTCEAAASRRCAGLGGRAVLFHQLSRLVLGRARCELRGEEMCDRGSHRRSGRRAIVKAHSSRMSSWLH